MKTKTQTFCFLAALLVSSGLGAAGDASLAKTGSQVGQRAPAFTLNDQNGKGVSLEALLKKGPVALVFIASADSCAICQLRMMQLQRNLPEIEASGGQVVGISFDPVPQLKRFASKETITFTLLSDVGSKTIDAYDMLNKQATDGRANHGVIIVDQKGVIRGRPILMSHEDRIVVEQLVNALKGAQNVIGETKP
jgi:peroxiredoxin Q/BCP